MENVSGYVRVLAQARVKPQVNKPFLGKPYLKYGQCHGIWGYFFQLGGILGAKHSANLDAFALAFIGAHGPPGAVQKFFTGVAKGVVTDHVIDSMTFHDYVSAEFSGRVHYAGDPLSYFVEHGMDKLAPGTAEELAWQYSGHGAALGAIYPHMIKQMFGRTHAAVPDEKWAEARSAGLNIPPEQDLMSYEETEEGEHEAFMYYCRECFPELYSVLNK